jgi:glucose/arabinose dehydrogenase
MLVRKVVGRTSQLVRIWAVLGAVVLAAILLALLPSTEAAAVSTLPSGFQESTVFSGLNNPTALQFSKDGQIFVAEKSGLIKVFDNLSDTTPTTFADLRTKVHDFWDRGMLGMVIDPNYPTNPYVYVLYTHDAAIGGTAPRWNDGCPTPPWADHRRLRGQRTSLEADRFWQHHDRSRTGLDRGLVPAVPFPLCR